MDGAPGRDCALGYRQNVIMTPMDDIELTADEPYPARESAAITAEQIYSEARRLQSDEQPEETGTSLRDITRTPPYFATTYNDGQSISPP